MTNKNIKLKISGFSCESMTREGQVLSYEPCKVPTEIAWKKYCSDLIKARIGCTILHGMYSVFNTGNGLMCNFYGTLELDRGRFSKTISKVDVHVLNTNLYRFSLFFFRVCFLWLERGREESFIRWSHSCYFYITWCFWGQDCCNVAKAVAGGASKI